MLKAFFEKENIEYYSELDFSDIIISNPEKYKRFCEAHFKPESAIIFLIPYYSGNKSTDLSIYAQGLDYHLYVKNLNQRFQRFIIDYSLDFKARILADSSPIDERSAVLSSGLGVQGKNGLIINEKYGSFFFIGEILLSKKLMPLKAKEHGNCINCGNCIKACPTKAILDPQRKNCISLLTQKKKLEPHEEKILRESSYKWGCDICQNICPMNKNAAITPIDFFKSDLITKLDDEILEMPDEEFEKRAFSWRGKSIIKRNIELKK